MLSKIKSSNLLSKFFDTFSNSSLEGEKRKDVDFFLDVQSHTAFTGGTFELLYLDQFILDETLSDNKREIDTIIAIPSSGTNWKTDRYGKFNITELASATHFYSLYSAETFVIDTIVTMESNPRTLVNNTDFTFDSATGELELLRDKIESTMSQGGKYYLRIPNLKYKPNVLKDKIGVLMDFTDTSIDFYDNRVLVLKNYALGEKTKGHLSNTINNLYLNNFFLSEETVLSISPSGVVTDKNTYTWSVDVPPNPVLVDPLYDIRDPEGYIGIGKTFPKYTPISVVGLLEDISNTVNWYRGIPLDKDIVTSFRGLKDLIMDDSVNALPYQQELHEWFTTFFASHFVNFKFYKNAALYDQGRFSITNIERILYRFTPVDLKIYVTASSANEELPPYTWHYASKFVTNNLPSFGQKVELGARIKEAVTETWYFASKFFSRNSK